MLPVATSPITNVLCWPYRIQATIAEGYLCMMDTYVCSQKFPPLLDFHFLGEKILDVADGRDVLLMKGVEAISRDNPG